MLVYNYSICWNNTPFNLCLLSKKHYSRILLFSWFDSNVCTILRHLSLIAWFICELIHFIMSCPFLKGLLSFKQWWVFGILVWTDTCFWNEEPNSSSKSGQSFAIIYPIGCYKYLFTYVKLCLRTSIFRYTSICISDA